MARTTAILIAGVTEVDAAIDLAPYILTANELVTEVCAPLGYTEARLEMIETRLAAHFYRAERDQFVASQGVSGITQAFQYKIGMNLSSTTLGQAAMMLDTLGGLAKLSKQTEEGEGPITVGLVHLGAPAIQRRCY
jgi:hypothetical protein